MFKYNVNQGMESFSTCVSPQVIYIVFKNVSLLELRNQRYDYFKKSEEAIF